MDLYVVSFKPTHEIRVPLNETKQLSLFMSDLVHATGTVMDIKWVNEGKLSTGTFCTTQGNL